MIQVHPDTQRRLEAMQRDEPHAILLSGPVGIGLSELRTILTATSNAEVLTVLPEKNEKVDIEKGTITVESIRRLYDTTRTRSQRGMIVVIDFAERMAPAAQNAFLKLLEEPGVSVRFVLLTHQPELLLPTIQSRAQHIAARPISPAQSVALLDELDITDATRRAQLLFIAEGLPAELTRLSQDESLFEARVQIVKDARLLIAGSAYERLLIGKKYKDSRVQALVLLEDALKLLRRTISERGDEASLRALTRYEQLHKRLSEQGNVRLQLSATVMV